MYRLDSLPAVLTVATAAGMVIAGGAFVEHHYFHSEERPHAAEWSYAGPTGPDHWGDLSPEYALAKTGRQQSPIDIVDAAPQRLDEINFEYRPAKINLVYNGHTIQETEERGSAMEVDGREYALLQFHFHAPSEHTIAGRHAAMEMHLVHRSATGRMAVVAVMIEEGASNRAYDAIWNYLPAEENKRLVYDAKIDAAALLPVDRGYYRYVGSFTTPPCTEGVDWFVLKSPVTLSAEQIEKFQSIVPKNNRPVQPLNNRRISQTRR